MRNVARTLANKKITEEQRVMIAKSTLSFPPLVGNELVATSSSMPLCSEKGLAASDATKEVSSNQRSKNHELVS